jgi:transcriptional regulator with XRE-family HTH domain
MMSKRVGEWRVCPVCKERQLVPPARSATWTTCKAICSAEFRRGLKPWNQLQKRCFERMAADGLSVTAFTRSVGVSRATFNDWVRNKNSTTSGQNLAKLASAFGILPEQALKEAGGVADEERRAETGRRLVEALSARHLPVSLLTRAKMSATHKGVPKTQEHREKIRAAHVGSPAAQRAGTRLSTFRRSPEGKLVHPLWRFLQLHPEPTAEDIAVHQAAVAARTGSKLALVRTAQRPYLQMKKLVPLGGRPRLVDRKRVIGELMATWPQKKNGDLADGFWRMAAKKVSDVEQYAIPIDAAGLKVWWKRQV